jgi:hypothetical protein
MTRLNITLDLDVTELYAQRLLLCYLEQFDVDGSPIAGLLSLTDAIADELSENGNDRALLNGSSGEDELGFKLLDELRQNLNFKPKRDVKPLKPYVVKLVEKGGCIVLDFPCDAEDPAHAREQANDAYKGCAIHQVLEYVISAEDDT